MVKGPKLIAKQLGGVRIQRLLSSGSLSDVYVGYHDDYNMKVAIKVFSAESDDPELMSSERFQRECDVLTRLTHRSLLKIFDAGTEGAYHYMITEHLDSGYNLATFYNKSSLTPYQSLITLRRLADVIAYLHEHGFLHRNINPNNIWLKQDGYPVLMDLGFVKDNERKINTHITSPKAVFGLINFLPPEQANRSGEYGEVSKLSDIYGLGATFYWMLTGKPPFMASSAVETILSILKEPIVLPSKINPSVPESVDLLCRVCLEKDPLRRPNSAHMLIRIIASIFEKGLPDVRLAKKPGMSFKSPTSRVRVLGRKKPSSKVIPKAETAPKKAPEPAKPPAKPVEEPASRPPAPKPPAPKAPAAEAPKSYYQVPKLSELPKGNPFKKKPRNVPGYVRAHESSDDHLIAPIPEEKPIETGRQASLKARSLNDMSLKSMSLSKSDLEPEPEDQALLDEPPSPAISDPDLPAYQADSSESNDIINLDSTQFERAALSGGDSMAQSLVSLARDRSPPSHGSSEILPVSVPQDPESLDSKESQDSFPIAPPTPKAPTTRPPTPQPSSRKHETIEIEAFHLPDDADAQDKPANAPEANVQAKKGSSEHGQISLHESIATNIEQSQPVELLSDPEALVSTGDVLESRYKILEFIGQGGMGTIYKTEDLKMGNEVAVKVAAASGKSFENFTARFQREARLGNLLGRESGFVRAFDWGSLGGGRLFLVMDLIPKSRPLTFENQQVLDNVRDFVKASRLVGRCHEQQIVHRDIKPNNFLKADDGEIYLMDFGLAKCADLGILNDRFATKTSVISGTPWYMSPEQFGDFKGVDKRADIYALGVMLFEILTGRLPFDGSPLQICRAQVKMEREGQQPDPRAINPSLTAAQAELCMKAMSLRLEERVASGFELADLIEQAFLNQPSIDIEAPVIPPETQIKKKGRDSLFMRIANFLMPNSD